jgi:glycosyltransferase involved in cell wall biosynthesis
MKTKLISVVVPAYNAEKYLAETLESIRGQDYQPHEVLVVDDGSTDNTAAIAKSYPEVRYIWQRNQGNAAAKNTGLANATGELISFLDADDTWLSGRSRIEAEYLVAHPEAGGVIARMRNFLQPGVAQPDWVSDEMLREDFKAYQIGTLLAHRWVFEQVGNFNAQAISADETDWFIRLNDAGIVLGILSEVVLRRRIHATNLSANHALRAESRLRVLKASIDRKRTKEQAACR